MAQMKLFWIGIISILIINLLTCTHGAATYRKRETQPEVTCESNSRCGWYIYDRNTRKLEIPMRACQCPDDLSCNLTGDDISVSAYEFKCQQLTENSVVYPKLE